MDPRPWTQQSPVLHILYFTFTEKISLYDSIDDDVLTSYNEFALASQIYFALREGQVSELSARMTAMDGASKNAGKNWFVTVPAIVEV